MGAFHLKRGINYGPLREPSCSIDVRLIVTQVNDEANSILIDMSRGTTPLTTKFRLPTKEYGLDAINVTDASISSVRPGEYRIVLYSAVFDCDRESGQFIWLLEWKDRLKVVTMISLSDLYKVGGKESMMLGSKFIALPAFANNKYQTIAIPLAVQIGNVTKITPMLSSQSIDLIRASFGREIDTRMALLTKPEDAGLLSEYKKARKELSEALSGRTIAF